MFNVVIRKINVDEKDIGKYIWHKDVKLYAIYNATGVRVTELPATPERIAMMVREG